MNDIMMNEIEKVLDEKVRPYLKLHGGNLSVSGLKNDVLYACMGGHCKGCPSAELTIENLVKEELKAVFPQLKQVILVTSVSDDLLHQARSILSSADSC